MMTKIVGWLAIIPFALFFLGFMAGEESLWQNDLYTLSGLMWLVFSTWAGALLLQTAHKMK